MSLAPVAPAVEAALAKLERLDADWRYAAENLYYIDDARTSTLQRIRFNEAQIRLKDEMEWFEKRRLPIRLWILKSRRAGLSTGVLCKLYHRASVVPNTRALIVANQDGPARNLLNICRIFWKKTPADLRPAIPAFQKDEPPKTHIEFHKIDSVLRTATAKSLDEYVSFGFRLILCSEVSRYPNGNQLFGSIFPTLKTDPNSMFFGESTALGMGNFFHTQCLNARQQQGRGSGEYGGFRLLFIPRQEMSHSFRLQFNDDAERRRLAASLTQSERDLMKRFPKQIGLEHIKWERTIRAGAPYNTDPEQFEQDYPTSFEEAFLASGVTVFGKEAIRRLSARKRPPEFCGDIYWGDPKAELGTKAHPYDLVRRPNVLSPGDAQARGYRSNVNEGWRDNLKIFRKPRRNERLFIGCDVGRGDMSTQDGDFSTIVVCALNESGGRDEVIITWSGHINPVPFAELASALAWWCRSQVGDDCIPPLLTVEFTGPGQTTNFEIDHRSLYDNCFRYFRPDTHGGARRPTNHIGWLSNGNTKPLMVDITTSHVKRDLIDIPDEDVITEMSIYRRVSEYDDKGAYAGVGGHDDFVTALEIAVVTMRRQDLNYGTFSKTYSAEVSDDEASGYGRERYSDSWDPDQADSAWTAPVMVGPAVLTAIGAVDPERLISGGDWRNYDPYEPSGGYSGHALDWDPW